MEKRLLVMNEKDNVGVLLESAQEGDCCSCRGSVLEIMESIEFAHKVALFDITMEENVVKYGENIGYALVDIKRGQWVHNHNMGCKRGK
jgi:hypothetical protein